MSYLKASVMGGVDGVITSFAVLAGASLMDDAMSTAAVVGFSSVIADGLSMGISEYLSSSSEAVLTNRVGRPVALGTVCFASFVVCGSFPVLMFLVARRRLLSCAAFAFVELVLLGAGQTVVTKEPLLLGVFRTSGLGACAGLVAYGVAYVVSASRTP